jgi:hypothetical protein
MTYTLTQAQLASINYDDRIFGTDRFMPPWNEIPTEFQTPNAYTNLVEALLDKKRLPDADLFLRPAFRYPGAFRDLNLCARGHLLAEVPREHKVAGVAYLISHVCEIYDGPEYSSLRRSWNNVRYGLWPSIHHWVTRRIARFTPHLARLRMNGPRPRRSR